MPSVTKYNSVHPEVVVAHVQSATANGEDEYDDDDALSPSIVGDYDEDRDDCEDDTSGTSESDIDDDDDDDDGGGGLGVNPESSDIEVDISVVLNRLRSSQRLAMYHPCRQAPRRSISIVRGDSDEGETAIPPRPRRRLPERFPTTTPTPTATNEPTQRREPIRAQDPSAATHGNPCLHTCMLFPLTDRSCFKCDMHTLVYWAVSRLHLCQILWEVIPVAERPENWEQLYEAAGMDVEEPRRMCGWYWWWRVVEDRSSGDLYAWRAMKSYWHVVKRLLHADDPSPGYRFLSD